MPLNMDFVESQFPALQPRDYIYLDNAGGSLVLASVAEKVSDYLLTASVQHGATYAKSQLAMEKLASASESVAKFINAERPEEIIMGPSTTALLRMLSSIYGRILQPGDEIIVSQGEHESNYGAWELLEKKGIKIINWPLEKQSLRLEKRTLENLMTARTKLVCFNHVSNILGTINPVRELTRCAHAGGAKVCVDGVAYAPHRLIDVADLEVDYYAFSFYKVYGPHHAVLYGRYDDLQSLPGCNHEFISEDDIPYKFQPGNVNYELAYSCSAIKDYIIALAQHDKLNLTRDREWLEHGFDLMAAHEEVLSKRLLDYLQTIPGVRIFGELQPDAALRVPTISFTVGNCNSAEIVEQIDPFNIGIRYGDFYARRLINGLGLEPQNGMVRVSMAHYNTLVEIDKLIEHLDPILNHK